VALGPETMALTSLPEGVSAFNGWANRVLFACYFLWTVLAARAVLAGPG
jgi:hypothetical protein